MTNILADGVGYCSHSVGFIKLMDDRDESGAMDSTALVQNQICCAHAVARAVVTAYLFHVQLLKDYVEHILLTFRFECFGCE